GTGSIADTNGVLWPSTEGTPDTRVPIAFAGSPFGVGVPIPTGVRLDQIAPTISDAIGFRRPHPDVRSGKPIVGVAKATAVAPPLSAVPLIVEIAWRGVGTAQLDAAQGAWPYLQGLVRGHGGSGTIDGTTGS